MNHSTPSLGFRRQVFRSTFFLLGLVSAAHGGIIASHDFTSTSWDAVTTATSTNVTASASVNRTSPVGPSDRITSGAVLGVYVGQTLADSTSVSSYFWQFQRGVPYPLGATGIPRVATGGGPYFHIAYATSSTGANFSQTPPGGTLYIGTYVDNQVTDSNDPSAYTWVAASSLTSTNGIPGRTAANVTYYLHLKHSQDNGRTLTPNTGEDASVFPAPVAPPSPALFMNANFVNVPTSDTTWFAAMSTPRINVSNTVTDASRLNVSFDLSANRQAPVVFRLSAFSGTGTPQGFREYTLYPAAINTVVRYNIQVDQMTVPPGGTDLVLNSPQIQFSFYLRGNSADAFSWPRGAGNNYNQVTVDNICYTSPTYFVSPTGLPGNSGTTESSPKNLQGAMDIAQPGDVICLLPGTYVNAPGNNTLVIDRAGTPSRWIMIRPASASNRPILRGDYWRVIQVLYPAAYVDIYGLVIRGWYDGEGGPDAATKNLSLQLAQEDAARLNTSDFPNDPAYTVYNDHGSYQPPVRDFNSNIVIPEVRDPLLVNGTISVNTAPPSARFNTGGIVVEGGVSRTGTGSLFTVSAAEGVHHVRIADTRITNVTGTGITTSRSDYIQIDNNLIYDCVKLGRYGESGISTFEMLPVDGSTRHKIFITRNNVNFSGSNVRWSRTRNSGGLRTILMNFSDGNGIIIDTHDIYAYEGRVLIQNNVCYENLGAGVNVTRSSHVDIINNTLFRNNRPNAASASIVDYYRRATILHSGSTPPYGAYTESGKPSYFTVTGQTSTNYGQIIAANNVSDVTIRNNILWGRTGLRITSPWPVGSNVSLDYNLLGRDGGFGDGEVNQPESNPTAALWTTPTTSFVWNVQARTATADAIFANITAPAQDSYLHLKTTAPVSPAANIGNSYFNFSPRVDRSGIRRPQAGGTDAGAYEDL